MLITEATPYDLRFRLLDVPVRVHPIFWLVTAILGFQDHNLPAVAIWIGCVFLSILVHEYGHALMARRFHGSPSILLYGLGGLCYSTGERTDAQRIAVLLAGPGAGFLLGVVVMLLYSAFFGMSFAEHLALLGSMLGFAADHQSLFSGVTKLRSETTVTIYENLLWINLMWGLVNLLPIWPLDGGQIFQVVMSRTNPRSGLRHSHVVSLVTAGLLAVYFLASDSDRYFRPMMFGMLAYMNYQVLQSLQKAPSFSTSDDDWWRR
ncbi:MAG: site-2 protease family protein [Isosphaeraceae bacterium]